MNTVERIVLGQISLIIGSVISYSLMNNSLSSVITTHLLLTAGVLYGFLLAKSKY